MAIKANFVPGAGVLSISGDGQTTVTLRRDAAGRILINNGAVTIGGGVPTIANTIEIDAFGVGGAEVIQLDESFGALPMVRCFGGGGNDVLIGGSAGDYLFGQAGNDTVNGKGGDDFLFGGAGNDLLTGGDGNDQVFGEAGNDRMVWNPGDDDDLFEGGDGNDTAEVNGGNGAESFTITANGSRVRFDRVNPAPFFLDIGTTENLVVNAGGGNDSIVAGNGLSSLIQLTVDGGDGDDTIIGGDGTDLLLGGDGDDTVIGGRGNDTAHLGEGNDTFAWNPGDGSDKVEGQAGFDTLVFNGANASEKIDLSANGGRTTLTRDIAGITMDLNDVESLAFRLLGGTDKVTINNLGSTDVRYVDIDLAGPTDPTAADEQTDTVIVNGSGSGDHITVAGANGSVTVSGLSEEVTIEHASFLDQLTIYGGGGGDSIDASALAADGINMTIDGGAGRDTITGGQGADLILGGEGNDMVVGGRGNDTVQLGSGSDAFVWNPGDGSDIVEGEDGTDSLVFNGASAAESIAIAAFGGRVQLARDVANVTMDVNQVEVIQVNTFDGADTVTIDDLTGTGVMRVGVDLADNPSTGDGDGQPDNVVLGGTQGDDQIGITATGGLVFVKGLAASVLISGAEAGNDTLQIKASAGNDTVTAGNLGAGRINLVIDGGAGNDSIVGSAGNDTVRGGLGFDMAQLGAGDDLFVWNPGDGSDTVAGQFGTDTLLFNGANIGERIELSANAERLRLTRDIAGVTMTVIQTERVQLNALGGADVITVNDLTGTDVGKVEIDLGAAGGGGDGQVDTIVINATEGSDTILVTNNNGVVTVSGLPTEVTITNFDANDRLVINGLGGDDAIQASGLGTAMLLTADGGEGADVLIGSDGPDTLLGGNGDDVLIGGPGLDVLDGGTGDNIVIQSANFTVTADTRGDLGGSDGDGGVVAEVALLRQLMATSFVAASDSLDQKVVTEPMESQSSWLARPQA